MSITEKPVDPSVSKSIGGSAREGAELLGLSGSPNASEIAQAMNRFIQTQLGSPDTASDVDNWTDRALPLGSLWGQLMVRHFGWQWCTLIDHDRDDFKAIGVVSHDRSWVIYPWHYCFGCLENSVEPGILMAFNLMDAGNVPTGTAGVYANLMDQVNFIVPPAPPEPEIAIAEQIVPETISGSDVVVVQPLDDVEEVDEGNGIQRAFAKAPAPPDQAAEDTPVAELAFRTGKELPPDPEPEAPQQKTKPTAVVAAPMTEEEKESKAKRAGLLLAIQAIVGILCSASIIVAFRGFILLMPLLLIAYQGVILYGGFEMYHGRNRLLGTVACAMAIVPVTFFSFSGCFSVVGYPLAVIAGFSGLVTLTEHWTRIGPWPTNDLMARFFSKSRKPTPAEPAATAQSSQQAQPTQPAQPQTTFTHPLAPQPGRAPLSKASAQALQDQLNAAPDRTNDPKADKILAEAEENIRTGANDPLIPPIVTDILYIVAGSGLIVLSFFLAWGVWKASEDGMIRRLAQASTMVMLVFALGVGFINRGLTGDFDLLD